MARDATCCFPAQSNLTPVMAAQAAIHVMGWRNQLPTDLSTKNNSAESVPTRYGNTLGG